MNQVWEGGDSRPVQQPQGQWMIYLQTEFVKRVEVMHVGLRSRGSVEIENLDGEPSRHDEHIYQSGYTNVIDFAVGASEIFAVRPDVLV